MESDYSNFTIDELLNICRVKLNKDSVSFIQIGANDGVENDLANLVLNENDNGYFFEPIDVPFNLLIKNKSNFKNCKFLKKAILPEILKENNLMSNLSDDEKHQGSSFTNINSFRHIENVKVDCITISNFIKEYNIFDIDFLFCDSEGIDNLIVKEFLDFIKPNIILFETADWSERDANLITQEGNSIIVSSNDSIKNILQSLSYTVIDFSKKPDKFKSNNIVAIKI